MDISNGKGIGVSLFVQGCHFHCKGCFNSDTWDFDGGKPWNDKIQAKFIELANRQHIRRVSILGGEPLADENVVQVFQIIDAIRGQTQNKKIWIYTGYTWEEIVSISLPSVTSKQMARLSAVFSADYVVDGKFDISKQDLSNKETIWAGSTNQRVIDVKQSLRRNQIVTMRD